MKLLRMIFFCLGVGLVPTSLSAAEVKESYPDGKTKVRYNTDDMKRKVGAYEEFFPGGKIKLRGQYGLGKKAGLWISYEEKSGRVLESWTYRNDLLDGPYVWNLPSGKPGIKATYHAGQLVGPMVIADEKNQAIRRISYPRSREAVEKATMSLYFAQMPGVKFTTPAAVKAPYKAGVLAPETMGDALNVTKLYRYLSGLPWQDVKVDAALSDKAAHAAVLLSKSEKLDMNLRAPEIPSDMDKAFLNIALAGVKNENLHRGSNNPVAAVLSFMEDSDEKEKGKIEHRQWMLSPGLQKVGFGAARRFVAMDVADGARPAKLDFNFIAYPGEGYYPKALIDPKAPWSVFINTAKGKVNKDSVSVTVQKLDEHYQPVGAILNTEIVATPPAANPAFGWSVIVFKTDFPSTEAARYWIGVQGVQTLGGAEASFGYMVDLIDVVIPEKAIAKGPDATAKAPAPPSADELKKARIEAFRKFLGKTVPDIQFSGRKAKMIASESDTGMTYLIEEPGETTIIKATTDADGKVVVITIDGVVVK